MEEIEFDCLHCGVHVYAFGPPPEPAPTRCSTCDAISHIDDPVERTKLKRILNRGVPGDLAMVVRHDDNGQRFIFKEDLTPDQAYLLESTMAGHKQWYTVYLYEPEQRRDLVDRLHLHE
jgi:hypothetical protein